MGIDPGKTTGLVTIEAESADDAIVLLNAHLSSIPATDLVRDMLWDNAVDLIAIERFLITPRTVSGTREGSLEALYTIGAVRYLCARANVPMRLQTASTAKRAVSDDRLKRLELDRRVKNPHERDALRHALFAASLTRGKR